MKAEINELSQDNPTANIRIRVNIQQTLTKRFLDLMQQYQVIYIYIYIYYKRKRKNERKKERKNERKQRRQKGAESKSH